ncbi:MAG: hypothetical protein RLZZ226_2186, partial [Pseudomonadota bacterium]
ARQGSASTSKNSTHGFEYMRYTRLYEESAAVY